MTIPASFPFTAGVPSWEMFLHLQQLNLDSEACMFQAVVIYWNNVTKCLLAMSPFMFCK